MTINEFIDSNRKCAINDIPIPELDVLMEEWAGRCDEPRRLEAYWRARMCPNHGYASVSFVDGVFVGYNFTGCYMPGSACWKRYLHQTPPVIVDFTELTSDEPQPEVDIMSLL